MSTISLRCSSSYGKRAYDHKLRRISSPWPMVSFKSSPASKEKEFSRGLQKLSIPEIDKKLSFTNVKFERLQEADEFGEFVAREAQLDEEYWTAAWLRAESHWEDRGNDRYAENHKRKFTEQEFNGMKKRYHAQLGEKYKCIVMVRKEDRNVTVLKSVVGTLDLSMRYLSYGETFPREQAIKPPIFRLTDRKPTSIYGYIANLCVSKSARRKGIATNMLQFAILSAKLRYGAEKVFVHVYRNNKPARGLYQKMGFEVVDAATSQLSVDKAYLLCLETSNYLGHSFTN